MTSQALSNHSEAEKHYWEIFERQELLHRNYRERYLDLTDINKKDALQSWFRLFLKEPKNQDVYNYVSAQTRQFILGEDYKKLIYYYSVTGQIQQAAQTLGLYLISTHTLIDHFIHDPQAFHWNPRLSQSFKKSHEPLDINIVKRIEKCFRDQMQTHKIERGFDVRHSIPMINTLHLCLDNESWPNSLTSKLITLFESRNYYGAPFPISFAGAVGGNEIKLLTELPIQNYDILNLGEQLHLITHALAPVIDKPYSKLTVSDFKELMPSETDALTAVFTAQEGFQNTIDHESLFDVELTTLGPVSDRELGLYGEMLQSIRDAEQSVFIDIFWMGGSIGMNLAKELMKKVIEDPHFSVFIITDTQNKFQYGTELDMVFRYMRAFSEKFTDKNFYITSAQINLKRTALPEFIDLLVTNKVVNDLHSNKNIKSFLEDDGFNLLAKSDHTKVMVVDGKLPEKAKAYVGSKNWTDSSGGANFDEVAEIKGPAAALILNSFYYDVFEAFILDLDPRLGGSMVKNHILSNFPGEYDNLSSRRKAVQKLLTPIDLIYRSSQENFKVPYFEIGQSVVAPTQNNIYGTEMSAIEQNIQVILGAKKQIIIDDQFLYDPSIVEALKFARVHNKVDIFIMLESLLPHVPGDKTAAHIPNNLFIPELTDLGIEVKWQLTPSKLLHSILEDHYKHPKQTIGATFHLKSITTDGVLAQNTQSCESDNPKVDDSFIPVLITGSANKDVMTMSGGFREYQVAVFDKKAVSEHDCVFWKRWHDPDSSITTDGLDFVLPQQAEQLGIKDQKEFLNFLRQLVFAPYNFTKDFF